MGLFLLLSMIFLLSLLLLLMVSNILLQLCCAFPQHFSSEHLHCLQKFLLSLFLNLIYQFCTFSLRVSSSFFLSAFGCPWSGTQFYSLFVKLLLLLCLWLALRTLKNVS